MLPSFSDVVESGSFNSTNATWGDLIAHSDLLRSRKKLAPTTTRSNPRHAITPLPAYASGYLYASSNLRPAAFTTCFSFSKTSFETLKKSPPSPPSKHSLFFVDELLKPKMASLRFAETNLSLFPRRIELSRNLSGNDKGAAKFRTHRTYGRRLRVCCEVGKGDSKSNGEEPPESLFMKELRRRGMTPTSLLEESKRSQDEEFKVKEEGGFSSRNSVSTDYEKALSNQRERSLRLNSEGLEGLVPRARVLLTLGGTFFLSFGPLILVTVALFSALYLYFGPTFVHDGSKMTVSPPEYIDPYKLLEDERIYPTAPRVK